MCCNVYNSVCRDCDPIVPRGTEIRKFLEYRGFTVPWGKEKTTYFTEITEITVARGMMESSYFP